ncbi:GTP-binding protein [uncultured Methanoregula sp.]|uniref:GTP-binding protein n=1 Tax=uncultured Methanoregula sp. TaxID=1005933 RepID=UPI002AABBD9F|nr:GTP-binding protein [uncultured Methanoregula sp.]
MISTGINALDEMLGGGIPGGDKVLYSMEPGVNGQFFMISTLSAALKKGLTCLVILPNTTVDAFRHDAISMHVDKKTLCSDKLVLIDVIDRERIQKGASSKEAKARDWKARTQKICRDRRIDVIFVYFDLLYEEFGLETALCILESARENRRTTLILEHLNLEGEPLVDRFIREHAFDLVLTIRASSHPLPPFSYFTLLHTSWAPIPVRSIPFSVQEGRVIPYIPKIVVIGPEKSGKSTFISHTSVTGHPPAIAGDPDDKTAPGSMDFGRLRWKDFDITLYGIPGQTEFDPHILPTLRHAMGVVIVIDANNPGVLPRANYLAGLVAKQRIPFVIAANTKRRQHVMTEKEIRSALALPREIPLYFISATEIEDVHRVLESLVDYITRISS